MFFPMKNWKSWLYMSFGLLTIIWIIMYFYSGFTGFLAAWAVCIGMSIFSIYDFRDIFYLKEQIEETKQLNDDFFEENQRMELSVHTIQDVNEKLAQLSKSFAENNLKLSANIKSLERFVAEFQTDNKNIKEGEQELLKSCQDWIHQWREEASDNVRRVLKEAFDAIDDRGLDGKKGLNESEYEMFLQSLPDDYKSKITNKYKSFDQIDSQLNKDGNINKKEFRSLMNVVCAVDD